jgi:hypothetical protein
MKLWLRQWTEFDVQEIAKSLLVIGVLKAECFVCHNISLSKDTLKCPECGTEFKYLGFRRKVLTRDLESQKGKRRAVIIEFEDFIREFKRIKAKDILGQDGL